jgi:hypothetical protein
VGKPRARVGGWCVGGPSSGDSKLEFVAHHSRIDNRPRAKRVRCPECNRRLTERIVSAHDGWYAGIPHHKPKGG